MRQEIQREKYDHHVSSDLVGGLNNVFIPVHISMSLDLASPELSQAYFEIDISEVKSLVTDMTALFYEVGYSARDMAITRAMEKSCGKLIINSIGQLVELYA